MTDQLVGQQPMALGSVRLFVYDLAAAHAFYTGKLGLRLQAGGERAGYLVYDAGHIMLIVEAVDPDAGEEDHALVGRFTGLSFHVADIAATYQTLRSLGVFFSMPPTMQSWGGVVATFSDSADNQMNLAQLAVEAPPSPA